jgi:hypothetical protein
VTASSLPTTQSVTEATSKDTKAKSRTFADLLIDCEEDRILRRCWSGCCERVAVAPTYEWNAYSFHSQSVTVFAKRLHSRTFSAM